MSGKLIIVPHEAEISGPLVFLAGPIQGAEDWHSQAIAQLRALNPRLNIASPRGEYPPGTFDYGHQVDWETKHLRRAAENGVILFWLAKEKEHSCERAYAQTTRFELAEWKMHHERDGVRLVVGIEEGFSNERYIRRRLTQDCPRIPLCATLEETCAAAAVCAAR